MPLIKEDKRRMDLVIPYVPPKPSNDAVELSATIASTIPMAAMFMRNKLIAWGSLIYAVQSWAGESADSRLNAVTPPYMSITMALSALGISYLPLLYPHLEQRKYTPSPAPTQS